MPNIIEIFKKLFNKNKIKKLPEAKTIIPNRINFLTNNSSFSETELSQNITSFLNSYEKLLEPFPPYELQNSPSAYMALVKINSSQMSQEQYQKNLFQENHLIDSLHKSNIYTLQTQGDKDNPSFYHIQSVNHKMPDYKDMIRIYLNCDSGNISELVQAILSVNQNPNFYLKFTTSLQELSNPRGEKIVLYCSENDYVESVQLLQYIKQIRPDLFKGSENLLPFLQKGDNFMNISRQPVSNVYMNLDNQFRTIPQSTNSYMANILEDSYIKVAKEIAKSDPELSFLLQPENCNNRVLFVKNYSYINSKYHSYLINSMQAKMKILSEKNNVYIDGITNITQPTEEYNKEYGQTERLDMFQK